MKSLHCFIFLMLASLVFSCSAQVEKNNESIDLSAFLSSKGLENASVGIMVMDGKTGQILAQQNPQTSLVPASIQKLFISGAALETLGPDHTFVTTVSYSGKIDEKGTLHGDIFIVGGGDPAFGSRRFEEHYHDVFDEIVRAIQGAGISQVNGNVVGDGSFFGSPTIPDTWIWEDIGNYYGGPAHGLNIYDNTYRITFSSQESGILTQIKKIEPQLPGIEFLNLVRAASDNRDNAYIYGSYLGNKREIRGTIPANRKAFTIKGAIPNPALLAANQLKAELKPNGISVTGVATSTFNKQEEEKFSTLLEIHSPRLSEIIKKLNQESINLYAETLLLHLAIVGGAEPSNKAGCDVLKKFWEDKGMNTSGLFLEDGSGLSRANAVTPAQMAFLLGYMKNKSPVSATFLESLPVSGVSGSLKNFAGEQEGKFRAKSGYMSRVLNYAGYLETVSGQELIVVMMVNNYTCSTAEMKKHWEELIISILQS